MLSISPPYLLLLLSLAFAQCKCHTQPTYDTTRAELTWSNQAQTLATTDFTLPAEGLTCFVPNNALGQDAVYFLSTCGKAWQFTQEQDGTLSVKTLPRLQSFDKAAAFVFTAGTSGGIDLYFGQISHLASYAYQLNRYRDVQVDLKKYDGTQWHKLPPQSLMVATPPGQFLMPIAPSSQPNTFPCTGCTFRKGSELWGCCMLPVTYTSTSGGTVPSHASGCFVFDPMAQTFIPCMPTLLLDKSNTQRLVTGLELEEPGKLVFLEDNMADSTPVLAITNDLPQELPLKIHNPFPAHQDWTSFSVCIDQDLSVIMPIFTSTSGNQRHFYQIDKTRRLEPVKSTALDLPANSLVLPFANCVYVLTTAADNQAGDIVYYKGEYKVRAK